MWAKVESRPESKAENSPESLSQRTAAPQATSASQHESVATLQPATAGAQGAPSRSAVRTLDPEEISLLIKEGEKHISTGDVITARMIFQRAAEAGDATAALALAATYDPTVLAKLGVMGMGADVEKARTWYQMAESFGSAEAKQRRELLDKR
jgi:TPR repeat protein